MYIFQYTSMEKVGTLDFACERACKEFCRILKFSLEGNFTSVSITQ